MAKSNKLTISSLSADGKKMSTQPGQNSLPALQIPLSGYIVAAGAQSNRQASSVFTESIPAFSFLPAHPIKRLPSGDGKNNCRQKKIDAG
jgi:hypothetical protein